jgi:hypothetical protein
MTARGLERREGLCGDRAGSGGAEPGALRGLHDGRAAVDEPDRRAWCSCASRWCITAAIRWHPGYVTQSMLEFVNDVVIVEGGRRLLGSMNSVRDDEAGDIAVIYAIRYLVTVSGDCILPLSSVDTTRAERTEPVQSDDGDPLRTRPGERLHADAVRCAGPEGPHARAGPQGGGQATNTCSTPPT